MPYIKAALKEFLSVFPPKEAACYLAVRPKAIFRTVKNSAVYANLKMTVRCCPSPESQFPSGGTHCRGIDSLGVGNTKESKILRGASGESTPQGRASQTVKSYGEGHR
jgi:hypothetical protein